MSEDTPQSEGEPSPASPEETPTAETTPLVQGDASAAETPAAETPAADASAVSPEAPSEAPTQATPAAEPAAEPAAAPARERGDGIFVPKWVALVAAAVIAALVFGGIGYAIGDSSDSSAPENASNTIPDNQNGNGTQQVPGGGQLPNGRQFPGGGQVPGGDPEGRGGSTLANAGFLGVGVQSADDGEGVVITEVADGSPAASAGLQEGDVITAIDGDEVASAMALRSAILAKESGDEITVAYTRDGASSSAKATLTSRSEAQSS